MKSQKHITWSRREFLRNLTIAGGAGLLGLRSGTAVAEPSPETSRVRIPGDPTHIPALCLTPQYVAAELLRLEGFSDIDYIPYGEGWSAPLELHRNRSDIGIGIASDLISGVDKNMDVSILGGLHVGCYELFANDRIQTIRDLKGRRVATVAVGGADHLLLSAIVAYIGIDPRNDIEWVVANPNDWMEMFTADKVDAIFSFPPMNYELHANKVGHVILNTTTDDPWRHYFCCMIVGRREFIRNYPIATKRVLRAFYKAGQLCSLEPARTARSLIEQGFAVHYDYTLQTLQDVSYQTWRDHDPADTLRFYALRLYDVDLIQHTPQQIIDQGTDWRFLNELKQELKA